VLTFIFIHSFSEIFSDFFEEFCSCIRYTAKNSSKKWAKICGKMGI